MAQNPAWLKLLSIFLIVFLLSYSLVHEVNKKAPKDLRARASLTIFPTPTPTLSPTTTIKVKSGDASVFASLTSKPTGDGNKFVTLSTTDAKTSYTIYSKTLPLAYSISLPQNSWSPDNKLFFVVENGGTGDRYLVYKLTGESFSPENFLDVTSFWSKSKINLGIRAITGWAGNNLLQIQTNKEDGSRGQNYWFTTDAHSFMPLSH